MQQQAPPLVVERAGADGWETVRAVRLAALVDSPDAFGSTLERELAFDDERWCSWVRDAPVFIASAAGRGVGIVAGAVEDDRAHVVSMWVERASRGGPAGSSLLRAVVDWATMSGYPEIELRAFADNARAVAFYERHDFTVAATRPSRRDAARDVHRMIRTLTR